MSRFTYLIILYTNIYKDNLYRAISSKFSFFLINIEREKEMMRLIRFVPKLSDRHVQQEVLEMRKDDVQ